MSCYDWPNYLNPDHSYSCCNTFLQLQTPSVQEEQDPKIISRAVLESIKIEISNDGYHWEQTSTADSSVTCENSPMLPSNSSYQRTGLMDQLPTIKIEYDAEPNYIELSSINNSFQEYCLHQNDAHFVEKDDIDDISNSSVGQLFDRGNLDKLLQTSPEELLRNANIDNLFSALSINDESSVQNNETERNITGDQSNTIKRNFNRKHYKCPYCTHNTNSKKYLTEHISKIHPCHVSHKNTGRPRCGRPRNKRDNNENSVLRERPSATKLNQKLYKCPDCSYTSNKTDRFHKHFEKKNCKGPFFGCDAHPKYPKRGTAEKENRLSRRSKNNSKVGSYKCHLCIYTSTRNDRLQKHIAKVHSKNVCYKCNVCAFESTYTREYYDHMKIHYKGPPYICESCSYKSKLITAFIAHRVTHTGDRLFNCTLCTFSCKRKYHLKGHMISHSKEKNFICMQCSKKYSYKCSLVRHLKTSCKGRTRCL
ncbi:hypothetical protein NPIL_314001 [Nephila pilipes]|uniref:C2H2-type domain-containing protein n=1 Tax=Nephila pilipes TaxID=299642 RepID=A0A8X6P5T6_NEPPI|nr:hypothetical protein NPIL_314001 [Nephila pilipes]